MSLVKDGPAPYAPATSILAVIDAFRSKSPATPVDLDVLERIGITHSLAPRTLQALKLLDLLDDEGQPTEVLKGLRQAPHDEFQPRLAAVVRHAYADVFKYVEPATDSPERIRDAFRLHRPPSMLDQMTRCFYGLCEASGIIEAAPSVSSGAGDAGSARPGRRAARPRPAASASVSSIPPQPSARSTTPTPITSIAPARGLDALHAALRGLLAVIPPADEPWPSRAKFESFKRAWDAALEISNPVPPNDADRVTQE